MVDKDETPFTVDLAQDRHAETRVPQGRHGHRGVVVLDFRWRRGGGVDVGRRSRAPRHQTTGTHPRLRELRARAGVVHHRPRRRHPEAAGAAWLEGRRCSSLRGERGLRRRHHGRHARRRLRPRAHQRQRRRLCPRPSDRRDRRAHHCHAGACTARARWRPRHCVVMYRRRRSDRHRGRGARAELQVRRAGSLCCARSQTTVQDRSNENTRTRAPSSPAALRVLASPSRGTSWRPAAASPC